MHQQFAGRRADYVSDYFFNRALIAVLTRFNCYIFQFDAVALVRMLLKRDSDDHNNDSNEMTSPMNSIQIYIVNTEKRSISECMCSLLAPLVCVIFFCVEIFNVVNFYRSTRMHSADYAVVVP